MKLGWITFGDSNDERKRTEKAITEIDHLRKILLGDLDLAEVESISDAVFNCLPANVPDKFLGELVQGPVTVPSNFQIQLNEYKESEALINNDAPIFDIEKFIKNVRSTQRFSFNAYLHTFCMRGKKTLYVHAREASVLGQGFGTASERLVVAIALKNPHLEGIVWSAVVGSIFFHLKMGRIPIEFFTPAKKFLEKDKEWLQYLKELAAMENEDEIRKSQNFEEYISFYKWLKQYPDDDKTEITPKELFNEKELFKKLLGKGFSSITYNYLPKLIRVLEKIKEGKKPDSFELDELNKNLKQSPLGLARWADAINNNKEFVPFRRFEQFWPYATENQVKILKELTEPVQVEEKNEKHRTDDQNSTQKKIDESELRLLLRPSPNQGVSEAHCQSSHNPQDPKVKGLQQNTKNPVLKDLELLKYSSNLLTNKKFQSFDSDLQAIQYLKLRRKEPREIKLLLDLIIAFRNHYLFEADLNASQHLQLSEFLISVYPGQKLKNLSSELRDPYQGLDQPFEINPEAIILSIPLETLILNKQPKLLARFYYLREKFSSMINSIDEDKLKGAVFMGQIINELIPCSKEIKEKFSQFFNFSINGRNDEYLDILEAQKKIFECNTRIIPWTNADPDNFDIVNLYSYYQLLTKSQNTLIKLYVLNGIETSFLNECHQKSRYHLLCRVLLQYGFEENVIARVWQQLKKGDVKEFLDIISHRLATGKLILKESELHCLYCKILPAVIPEVTPVIDRSKSKEEKDHKAGPKVKQEVIGNPYKIINNFVTSLLNLSGLSSKSARRLAELKAACIPKPGLLMNELQFMVRQASNLAFFVKYGTLTGQHDRGFIADSFNCSGYRESSLRMIIVHKLGLNYSKKYLEKAAFKDILNEVMFRLHLQPLLATFQSVPFSQWSEHAKHVVHEHKELLLFCRNHNDSHKKIKDENWLLKYAFGEYLQSDQSKVNNNKLFEPTQKPLADVSDSKLLWQQQVLEKISYGALNQCREEFGQTSELLNLEALLNCNKNYICFKELVVDVVEWENKNVKNEIIPSVDFNCFGLFSHTQDSKALIKFRQTVINMAHSYSRNHQFQIDSANFKASLDYLLEQTPATSKNTLSTS